jgi:predicted HicB family RNase H-like nuclease
MAKKVSFATKPAPKTVDEWVENPKEEKTKRFTIDIPESLHRRMKAQCALRGIKMNKIIQELLEREFPA